LSPRVAGEFSRLVEHEHAGGHRRRQHPIGRRQVGGAEDRLRRRQCTASACNASTAASDSHSQRLRKKCALKDKPCSARALNRLKNWNNTKAVKASVSA
jgi:hypothetical protein